MVGDTGRGEGAGAVGTAWFSSVAMAVGILARYGAAVEVIDPPEVRAALGRLGAELAWLYGTEAATDHEPAFIPPVAR